MSGANSALNVSGAIASFVGTGNQIAVTNSLVPTQDRGTNVAAYVSGTGSSVTVSGTPYKNLTGNTVNLTGSMIQATGGGKVTISGN